MDNNLQACSRKMLLNVLIVLIMYMSAAEGCMECCYYPPSDCHDYKFLGHTESGVYRVYPSCMRTGYDVYCDMTTDGGGWLVFQRRIDGSENFTRGWKDYSIGFGNVGHEHWLGDAMEYHNGMKFTTKDKDNDNHFGQNCADTLGPWWHNSCILQI